MSEPNEFRAYFTLTGEFDPSDITTFVGLQPTEQWRKGEIFGKKKQLSRKFSRWSLGSRLSSEAFVEEHVKDVLVQLQPVKEKITSLKQQWKTSMETVSFFKDNPQGFFFEAETISALADMKLGLGLSLYYEEEDESADHIQN